MKYLKNEDKRLSTHFHLKEFKCPCDDCKEIIVEPLLVVLLESTRSILGTSLKITSGYRCANYQAQLRLRGYETAKGISTHELGRAADITNGVSLGFELEEAARKAGFKAVGVGKNWIHVDLRNDKKRSWSYGK